MKQRKFQINFGSGGFGQNSGGEYVLGSVSQDFACRWEGYFDSDLPRHLLAISDENFDNDDYKDKSPLITDDCEEKEDQPCWYDINDLEHLYGICFEGSAYVVEIGDDGNQIRDTEIEIDPHILHTRQTGINEDYSPPVAQEDFDPEDYDSLEDDYDPGLDPDIVWQPVVEFYHAEKGQFHEWVIETDGEDFDPHKLVIAVVHIKSMEGSFFVEKVFYDEEEIEGEDNGETNPTHAIARVGWVDITGRKQMKEIGLSMWDIKQQNYENSWSDCRKSIATSISDGETRIKS